MNSIHSAKQLFLTHHGKNHRQIEREMHALGYTTFSRRRFYNHRTRTRKLRLGWIEKFGWKNQLSEPPVVTGGFSEPGAVATGFPCSPNNTAVSPPYLRKSSTFPAHAGNDLEAPPPSRDRNIATPCNIATSISSETSCNSATPANFPSWLPEISPTLRWDWPYQKLIYEKLQAITDGSSKRLMIFLPPRHGKSELVTVRYTAWRLKNDPALNVILGSYNQRLANRFSRKVRITWEDSIAMQNAECRMQNESIRENSREFMGKTNSSPPDQREHEHSPLSAFSYPLASTRRRLNTVAEWETGLGGGLRAVGVGGGITGFGAGLVVIDDPVKSRAEAESKTYREKLWEWYRDDLYTRLEPNASIILIQTRWHEDDLAGRLLKEMNDGGEHWDVISLPALAESTASPSYLRKSSAFPRDSKNGPEAPPLNADRVQNSAIQDLHSNDPCSSVAEFSSPRLCVSAVQADPLGRSEGDPLCPDRFTRDDLLRIKRNLGTYSFSALYQQRPVPAEGGLFKRNWFSRTVDQIPPNLRWCRGYDLALSTNDSADFTASFRCAIDRQTGVLYIADGFRKRIEFPDQRRYILARILDERFTEHGIEQALHGLAFIQEFRREHRLVSRAFRAVKVTADKFTRALSWANRAEEGKVILVRGPWIDDFLEEVTSFPNGAHDDQIDAVSIAVEMLNRHQHIARSF